MKDRSLDPQFEDRKFSENISHDAKPKISIITAAINALEGLKHTVENIQTQSFQDFEHIIVDGGSSDGTRPYLESLGNSVRWISEPDSGIADALNKGLSLARGRYILVLHAEDTFLDVDSLEKAMPPLSGNTELVSFDVLFSSRSGDRRWNSRGLSSRLNFKTTIPHQGVFVHRSLFQRIGPFDPSFKIAMDYEIFLRAYRAGTSVTRVPTVLSRMPDTGISSRRDWASIRERFAEERRIHLKHCPGPAFRLLYEIYWPLYLFYRRIRCLVA